MDTETLERPCMNCGRRTHRLLHDGNGFGLCGSARLAGYEPPGCAKWETTDELGRPTVRYVRARRNGPAVARALGPWSYVAPDGRSLAEEPPESVKREAVRLRAEVKP
jgi:hypothetical protein